MGIAIVFDRTGRPEHFPDIIEFSGDNCGDQLYLDEASKIKDALGDSA